MDGIRARSQRVIDAAEMRTWITSRDPKGGWRDIVRRAIAIYETRNGIVEQYQIIDDEDRVLVGPAAAMTKLIAERMCDDLSKEYTERTLYVSRRLVGKWERLV